MKPIRIDRRDAEELMFLLDLELWSRGGERRAGPRLVKRAQTDPAAVFRRPADVLRHRGLTDEEKLRILRHWEHDARELAVAEEEGMGGGERGHLHSVLKALGELRGSG